MATKRKFSAKQIAAQKLFAQRARAGTLGKTKKRRTNPAKPKSARPSQNRRGPATTARRPGRRPTASRARWSVHRLDAHGRPGAAIAVFYSESDAGDYARALADSLQASVGVARMGGAR